MAGPEDKQEQDPLTEQDDTKAPTSPRKDETEKDKSLKKKFPSPPQSPLRFLLQPAMNMLARLTKGEAEPFGDTKPLDIKGFRRTDFPKFHEGKGGRGSRNRALAAMTRKSKGRKSLEKTSRPSRLRPRKNQGGER